MKSIGMASITLTLIILAVIMALFAATLFLTGNQGSDSNADLNTIPTPSTTPDLNQNWEENNLTLGKTTTVNGLACFTGPKVAGRVLWKWDFDSIKWNTCDNSDGNAFFCDPTQFSLSLAERLERIQKLAEEGKTEEASALKEFDSLLIPDNYSEDFQRDFAFYYSSQFFSTPTWFKKWAGYFADANRLYFSPRNLSGKKPGYFRIKLSLDFNEKEFEFFSNGKPSAKIKVLFNRIKDFNAPESVFYSIPFNGMAGTVRKDSDGKIERKGYGIGFRENGQKIVLQEKSNEIVDTSAEGGLKKFVIAKPDEFQYTNTQSGIIAFISENDGIITFSPQCATVAIASLEPEAGGENLFYRIYEDGKEIGEGKPHMAYWKSVSKDDYPEGHFFDNLATLKPDARAESGETCNEVINEGGNAFGLHLDRLVNKNAMIESYFFTPLNKSIIIENACSVNPELVATARETSPSFHERIELGNSSNRISRFYELLELTHRGEVCMSESGGQAFFYWNVGELKKQEEKAISQIKSKLSKAG